MESKEPQVAPEAPHSAQTAATSETTAESASSAISDTEAATSQAEHQVPEAPPSGQTLETLTAELAEQQQKAQEYLDHLQRLQADFQNYRRRVTQEKLQAASRGKEDVLVALFPILANLHLALQHAEQDATAVRQGVQMIWQQFEGFLRDQKVERVVTLGERFDPALHEVLSTVPATADTPADTIVTEVKAGYLFEGRLLCPAQVIVAKAASAATSAADTAP